MPDICAPSLQEESLPAESTLTTETKERASLPGLLIEATRITRYDFEPKSCFSGVLGYPGLAEVEVLVSDNGEWS